MQCVVLAGGLGTRIRSLTGPGPKYLVRVCGAPFADHQLALLAAQGFRRVLLCTGYGGAEVRNHVGDGSRFGLSVEYCDEGQDLRGTGGALRLAFDTGLLEERFAVLYGDSYLPIDVEPIWNAALDSRRPALMTAHDVGDGLAEPNVAYTDGVVQLYRKGAPEPGMHHVDYGLSVFRRDVIEPRLPREPVFDLAEVFHALSVSGHLAGFEVTRRFYEVGSPVGWAALEAYLDRTVSVARTRTGS